MLCEAIHRAATMTHYGRDFQAIIQTPEGWAKAVTLKLAHHQPPPSYADVLATCREAMTPKGI